MKILQTAFQKNLVSISREAQIIETIHIDNGRLIENYYQNNGKLICGEITDKNGDTIFIHSHNCEWIGETFFRNGDILYGFSIIEKSASIKLFLTPIKAKIDFETFEILGKNYAKDKNFSYYGPGGKIIRERELYLYYDETYLEEWYEKNPDRKIEKERKLWNSQIAISEKNIYWKGILKKGVDTSLKRVNQYIFLDATHAYYFDLQNIKVIPKVDRNSVIYKNKISDTNKLKSFITDKYKPIGNYFSSQINDMRDFREFRELFEELRGKISEDYWWYKMESKLGIGNKS